MPADADVLRRDIVAVCQRLYQRGFIAGTGECQCLGGTRPAVDYPVRAPQGAFTACDLLLIDLQGHVLFGNGRPSSETPMHLALYRCRPDIGAVVHAHPPLATALTVAGYRLEPPLLPEAVVALGEVPTIPYQMPTTWQFANDVGAAMRQAEAALLENHGSVAVGATLQAAFNKMEIVERAAQILYLAKLLGRVQPLSPEAVTALQALRQS